MQPPVSEALGPHHRVEEVGTDEYTKQEQQNVHHYTQSQNRIKPSSTANAAKPSTIISKSNIKSTPL
jgi:hypothetical protein